MSQAISNASDANAPKSAEPSRTSQSVVQLETWSSFAWLRAGFSTRLGGESSAYGDDDLNLGWTDSDQPTTVAKNRKHFVESIGAGEMRLVTVRQFHGNLIRSVDGAHGPLATADGKAVLRGDALMTATPGLLLGVQTADCVPILIADSRQRVVAAFHAGWRGTLARIVQRGVGNFQARYRSHADNLIAAIGPCIGPCCFAVGDDVRRAFTSQFAYSEELLAASKGNSVSASQVHLDLVKANQQQLLDAGVVRDNIVATGECTACTRTETGERKYFSHRAECGFTGRMLSVIGVVPE